MQVCTGALLRQPVIPTAPRLFIAHVVQIRAVLVLPVPGARTGYGASITARACSGLVN